MPIAHLTLELRIEGAHSLKDRRQVLRSLKDRLRSSFNVSVAEIDPTDLWQSATLGVVAISSSRHYLEGLMKQVESAATRIANNHGAEITDSFVDFLDRELASVSPCSASFLSLAGDRLPAIAHLITQLMAVFRTPNNPSSALRPCFFC